MKSLLCLYASAVIILAGCVDEGADRKARLTGHRQWVNSLAFSPDGTLLASGGGNYNDNGSKFAPGDIRLWDVNTGQQLHELLDSSGKIFSVAFAPDGKRLASGAGVCYGDGSGRTVPGEIRIWDVASGKELACFKGHKDLVSSVVFTPDGASLVSASCDGTIKIWDLATGHAKQTLLVGANAIAISPCEHTLAAGMGSYRSPGKISLWDLGTMERLATLRGHTAGVCAIAFAPDGKLLASGSHDKTIRLWDVELRESLEVLGNHEGPVNSVAFSPDGKTLASGSGDRTIKLWDVEAGDLITNLGRSRGGIHVVSFSPDAKMLAGGDAPYRDAGRVSLWDVAKYTAPAK